MYRFLRGTKRGTCTYNKKENYFLHLEVFLFYALARNCSSICSSNGKIACCSSKRIYQVNKQPYFLRTNDLCLLFPLPIVEEKEGKKERKARKNEPLKEENALLGTNERTNERVTESRKGSKLSNAHSLSMYVRTYILSSSFFPCWVNCLPLLFSFFLSCFLLECCYLVR